MNTPVTTSVPALALTCYMGISSRGLHHFTPFKLPEYMAASIAIASEPSRNEFASPFVDGRDYLEFRTPEECVERCDRLLSAPALAWRYFQSEVQLARHVELLLERALQHASERGRMELCK